MAVQRGRSRQGRTRVRCAWQHLSPSEIQTGVSAGRFVTGVFRVATYSQLEVRGLSEVWVRTW